MELVSHETVYIATARQPRGVTPQTSLWMSRSSH